MPFQSEKQRKYLHANHPEIAKRWEKEYATGGISNLFKNRTGFHRGSTRHQLTHDYKAYAKPSDYFKWAPPSLQISPEVWNPERDAMQTTMKERFMYGEPTPKKEDSMVKSDMDKAINAWLKELFTKKKRKEHATGGISNLFKLKEGGQLVKPGPGRQGYNGQGDYTPDRSTGGGGPPGGGDPGMTYTAPTVSTTAASEDAYTIPTQTVTAPGDGDAREKYIQTQYTSPEALAAKERRELRDLVNKQEREKTETWEQAQQWQKPNKFVSFIKNAALAIIPGLLPAKMAMVWKAGKGVYDYKTGKMDAYLPAQFRSDGKFAKDIAKTITENAEKRKTDKAELDLIKALPEGHPERIQLEGLKKKTPDDVHERDNGQIQETKPTITIDAEEVNDAKTQLLRKYQEMNEASRLAWLRQQEMEAKRQAYLRNFRQMHMSAQGGRVPQGYNTGGLSNLFKLKNV